MPDAFSVLSAANGIPEQDSAFIFERLARVAKWERSGLGLALYISKCIVEEARYSKAV